MKSIRAEKRRCNPELLQQYPEICHKGIRQFELEPIKCKNCAEAHKFTLTGHFHFVVDGFTFISKEPDE
jgi:hypothetical protein